MNIEPARMASYQSDLSMIAVESGSMVDWQEEAATTKDDSNRKLISFAGAILLICGVFAMFADLHASMSNRAVMITAPKCSAPESKETLRLFLKAFYGVSMSQDSVRQAYMEEMMKHVSGDVVIDNDLDERVGQDDDAAEWERRSNHYEGRDSVPRWALKFDSFGRELAKARGERTFGVLANGDLIHIVRFGDDDDTKASVIASGTQRNEEGRCVMTGVKFARGLNTREIPQPVADGTVTVSNDTLQDIVQNGLGKAFYLPKTNIMNANAKGTRFFTDKVLEDVSCVMSTPRPESAGRTSRQMSIFKSMKSFVSSVTTNADIGGSFKTAAFTAQGTVQAMTTTSSTTNSTFYSSKLDVYSYVRYIEFQKECTINEGSINQRILKDFHSLPLISSTDTPYKERWDAYGNFLSSTGSHIMTEMNLGSRLIIIESTTTETEGVEKMLAIKACVAVEGVTPSASKYAVNSCAAYNSTQRRESATFSSQTSRTILGGTNHARLKLASEMSPENLDSFIMTADEGTTPVRMGYTAVWDWMIQIYQSDCLNSKSDTACQSMQRAKNLQAYYEGFSAFGCTRKESQLTSKSILVIQQMKQTKYPNSKWSTYFCWAHKDGCTSNDDCHGLTSCYCYGKGCVASKEDDVDASVMRPEIRRKEIGGKWDGVNNACYFYWGACKCRKDYEAGQPSRHLWDQA